jgi:hypothetical protein
MAKPFDKQQKGSNRMCDHGSDGILQAAFAVAPHKGGEI